MHKTFTIRELSPADVSLLRALNALFADIFADPESYGAKRPSDAYLQQLLAKKHVVVLVVLAADAARVSPEAKVRSNAEGGQEVVCGQEVVGGLVAYELEKFEQARSELYIYDLAVAAAHRRKGIATALIERLREIASQRGAWVVYVQADYGDDPAIALYEKLGKREEVLHFDIAVSDSSPVTPPGTPNR